MQAECGFAVFRLGADVAAVGLHQPGAGVVLQRHFNAFVDDAGFEFGRENRGGDFDAAEEVAPHPVGAGDEGVVRAVVVEAVHARVFELSADNGADADVFGQAFDAGAQGTHAAHDEVDLHACAAGAVEGVDDARLDQ